MLLHLLLVSGTAFLVQGAQVYEQKLHPQYSSLNHSLSMIGFASSLLSAWRKFKQFYCNSVLAILVPTVFFAALDHGPVSPGSGNTSGLPSSFVPLVSDGVRRDILRMSRGISIMLLVMYVGDFSVLVSINGYSDI